MPTETEILSRIKTCGVIAVLTIDEVRHAVPLARALWAGGVGVMELTLRTPAALGALRAIVTEMPDMLAGVGTILTPQQVAEAARAGAAFGVAPGLNPRVVAAAREAGLYFAPGVATPSDVEHAVELGCKVLKFFPAEPMGGLAYLKSMAAPYAHLGLKFIPLGGLTAANMKGYLQDPLMLAVGGSWLAPAEKVRREDWGSITRAAQEAAAAVKATRAAIGRTGA